MKTLEQRCADLALSKPWLIIFLTFLIVPLIGSGGQKIVFTTDYRVFFSEDNPQLMAFDKLEKTYAKNDNVLFVLEPPNGNVFTRENLSIIESFTEKAWLIPYTLRVDSITNFQHSYAENDDLMVHDLVENASELSDEELTEIREIAIKDIVLKKRLISESGDVTAINVTIHMPGEDPIKETPKVMAKVREMEQELKAAGFNVHVGGLVVMDSSFSESSIKDMQSLVPLSFFLMLLTLGLLLKSALITFATLFVILFSIVTAMGMGGHLGIPLSPPSASAPTIILTVAIANCVHILKTLTFDMGHGMSKENAIREAIRVNFQPVFLASFTTALGFLSLNTSEVPPFRHLGNLVAMGVMASCLLSLTFLPALLSKLPIKVKHVPKERKATLTVFGEWVIRQRKQLLFSGSALALILIAFVPRNELNDVFVRYFDETVSFRRAADFTVERLTGLYQFEFSLSAEQDEGIYAPEYLSELEGFAAWLREQPEVIHVSSISDTIKKLNMNMNADDPEFYVLPENRQMAAQLILLLEMSLPFGLDLNTQINVNKSATRVTAVTETLSTNESLDLEERALSWLASNTKAIKSYESSGTITMFSHIGKRNIVSLLIGAAAALFLISLILIFVFRSLKIGGMSIISNLLPSAMGFGLWGIMVGEVGLALSTVVSMTLGIVVDDTVHFLSKYLRARREKGLDCNDAVVYSFSQVGGAMTVTSVVLIIGFLVLSLSSFKLNSAMGLLTAIVIGFALLVDFLILPPLLTFIDGKKQG